MRLLDALGARRREVREAARGEGRYTATLSTGASASMGSRGCSGIVTFRSSTTRAVGGAVDAREVSYRERIGVVSREGIVVLFMRKMDDVFGLCAQVIIEVLTGDELDAASDG